VQRHSLWPVPNKSPSPGQENSDCHQAARHGPEESTFVTTRWLLVWAGWLLSGSAQAAAPDQAQATRQDRSMSCDPSTALTAAREILSSSKSLNEPLEWFTPALTLFQHGQRDEALFWFYAAQLRTRYQLVFERGDRPQLLSVMLMTVGGPINNYGFQDPPRLLSTFDRVLAWDRTTPNPWRDRAQTAEQQAQVMKIYEGFEQLRQKVRDEGTELKQQATQASGMYAKASGTQDRCKPGQTDPSQVPQLKREEQRVRQP
jgi:hypothetical protein